MKKNTYTLIVSLLFALLFTLYTSLEKKAIISYSKDNIPEYNGEAYIYLDNNEPHFDEDLINTKSFEKYSELDYLGRAGTALANIGTDLMPVTERESIGSIKPSGWQISKYDFIEGKYLYNRCHLIGYQLTGENKNKENLITCTRYMNVTGMLEWENKVASYIQKTSNHVLYRVTPYYKNDNLVASGVEMEAYSVEDKGKGIKFHIYVYNVQPGVKINYKTGENKKDE